MQELNGWKKRMCWTWKRSFAKSWVCGCWLLRNSTMILFMISWPSKKSTNIKGRTFMIVVASRGKPFLTLEVKHEINNEAFPLTSFLPMKYEVFPSISFLPIKDNGDSLHDFHGCVSSIRHKVLLFFIYFFHVCLVFWFQEILSEQVKWFQFDFPNYAHSIIALTIELQHNNLWI